jgi:hypothetical protein
MRGRINWRLVQRVRAIYAQSGKWPPWASWKLILWVKAVYGIS